MRHEHLFTYGCLAALLAGAAGCKAGAVPSKHQKGEALRMGANQPGRTPPLAPPVQQPAFALVPTETRTRDVFWPFTTVGNSQTADLQRGGLIPATIQIGPNPANAVRVSVQERGIDNVGQQLRASLWMASFLAASSLDQPLTCCTFSVAPGSIEGTLQLDGYSAGAITTAAMMAALLNTTVRPDVTMTGAVNPDGSVAPVGGLKYKLLAAVRAGMKEFGYPTGQHYVLDETHKRTEDLRELGKKHRIKVTEIRDVSDAYRLLTGVPLVQAEAASVESMEGGLDWMKGRAEDWLQQARDEANEVRERLQGNTDLSDGAREYLSRGLSEGEKMVGEIKEQNKSQMYAQAYDNSLRLFRHAYSLTRMYRLLSSPAGNSPGALLNSLVNQVSAAEENWQATKQELEVRSPVTMSETIELIDQYSSAIRGWAVIKAVKDELKDKQDKSFTGEDFANVYEYHRVLFIAESLFDTVSKEQRNRGGETLRTGPQIRLDPMAMHRLAQAYTSAALANQKYLDEDMSRRNMDRGRILDATRNCRDILSYTIANEGKTGIHAALANLGAAIESYGCVAGRLTPLQSVTLRYDKDRTTVVNDKRGFVDMLVLADKKAREAATLARLITKEEIPLSSRQYYTTARMLRESEQPSERISALTHFWESSIRSRLAVLIYRTALAAPTELAKADTSK